MAKLKRLWITGYRSYELGVFSAKSPKMKVLRQVLKEQLIQAVEEGYNWFITGAQLGTEQWWVTIANQLKKRFPHEYQIAVMLPFKNFGERWNEDNQIKMAKTIQYADFSRSVSAENYQSPAQFFNYQQFMLTHTDAALLIYDPDYPGRTKYDYQKIKQYASRHYYSSQIITMDDLQDAANELQEKYEEKHGRG